MSDHDIKKLENLCREIKMCLKEASELPGDGADSYDQLLSLLDMELADARMIAGSRRSVFHIAVPDAGAGPSGWSRRFVILAVFLQVLALGSVFLFGYRLGADSKPADEPGGSITLNWADIERGRLDQVRLREQVSPNQRRTARAFFVAGQQDLQKQNRQAAKENFRMALSLDPGNTEYENAFRQLQQESSKP